MTSTRLKTTILVGAAATALLAAPLSDAGAATPHARVTTDGNVTTHAEYVGGSGQNALRVWVDNFGPDEDTDYLILRDRVPIDIAKGSVACDYLTTGNPYTVRCKIAFDTPTEPSLGAELGAGNDTLRVSEHDGVETFADMGSGNDTAYATNFVARVHGDAGNDKIFANGDGGDIGLYGDDGNDSITGSKYGTPIYGGPGNDTIHGENGPDTIYGNSGNDTLYGDKGNDTISGGPGKDKISGGSGTNKITQ